MMILKVLVAAAFLVLTALAGAGAAASEPQHNRLNVLFISVDDLRPELGCYGASEARSPCLDRLAARGVVFTRQYVQVPTCGASRYALLTGRSPHRSGVTRSNNALYQGPTAVEARMLEGAQTLPELFRRSGYRTVCVGKISHTPDGRVYAYDGRGDGRPELPGAWDELATPHGAWKRGWGAFFAYSGGKHREDGQGHGDLMEFVARSDEELPDGLIAHAAVDKLHELKERKDPFFLAVGFFKPHLPFVATRDDWDAFEDATIPLPPTDRIESPHWHSSSELYRYDFPFPKERPLADDARRSVRRAYFACVRYVDRQVGKVIDALEDLGLSENTVVVVWGDHGWHLGEQRIWGKHTPLERSLRSVLIVRAPGVSRAGLRCDALVETTDIYPTILDLCRPRFSKTRYPLDGKSLRPLLAGLDTEPRDAATSYWGNATSVRTTTHRLVATTRDGRLLGAELYDLTNGPDAMDDLAEREPELTRRLTGYVPGLKASAPLR